MNDPIKYDVVILGGGIAGSLLALQLLELKSNLKIAIIEKSIAFPQKIGESTSDITAMILKKLKLDVLLENHPEKTGLRFIFNEDNQPDFKDTCEFSSPALRSPINGFHINRKKFDQDLLDLVCSNGATIFRPAEIIDIKKVDELHVIQVVQDNNQFELEAKFIVDASGRARILKRYFNLKDQPVSLKTSAVMAHFKNILPRKDWQLPKSEYWVKHAIGSDDFSTIHFMRNHCWWWFIRIDDQTTSVGLCFDERFYNVNDKKEFFLESLKKDFQLRHILGQAEHSDIHVIDQMAYCTEKLYGEGYALIGDAGAFIDPLVSPGIELILQQTHHVAGLITSDLNSQSFNEKAWKKYESVFIKSYHDRAMIYNYGYQFIGSYRLFRNWLRLGFFGYFGKYVFTALIFPKKMFQPLRLSALEKFAMKFVAKRLIKKFNSGKKLEHKPNDVSFSYVFVSRGLKKYLIPFRMFFLWFFDSIALEFNYLFRSKKKL